MAKVPFNKRIREARRNRNWTQEQLAAVLSAMPGMPKIKQTHIERMENRAEGSRSYYTAQIAEVCGVSPIWLATGEGEKVRPTDLPDDALAVGAAWFFLKGATKDNFAADLLETAINFLPAEHPLYKAADRLYQRVRKRKKVAEELAGKS